MIKYDYTVTVTGNTAKIDKDIYLFRGNKNVHYYFAVKNASFNFKGSTDLIEKTNAINAAVTVIKPNNVEVANAIAEVENGKIHLKVTEDLIDEEVEVGDFDLVFDLFDDTDGAVTIPKVQGQFHVLERPCTTPISELAVTTNTTNEVDKAITDYAIATYAEPVASTNADGTFAKKTWVAKEKITTAELNRMEEGISDVSSQCQDIAKQIEGIKSSSLINQNGGGELKIWAGTKVEYDALLVKDEDTVYLIEGGQSIDDTTTYAITNNLTNCTNSNTNTSANANSSYSATISANNGYTLSTVTVTMGGTDMTSTVYTNGSVFIEKVTGDIIITCTAIQNSGEAGDTTEPVYTLANELTLDGIETGIVDTGIGLFDADRDFTIFADFTPNFTDINSFGNNNNASQPVLFRVKQSNTPWIGVDISWNVENITTSTEPGQSRGDLIAHPRRGIYLGKMSTGIGLLDTTRHKFVIKRVASKQKMYFYDEQGLIGSYNDAGTVSSNLFDTKVVIGGYSNNTTKYFKGTVHGFRIWYDALDDTEITTLLS